MAKFLSLAVVVSLLTCASALAQQTTGDITGRVFDQQGKAVPGATVTAKNPDTGFTRAETSDSAGVYRLAALPVGVFDITAELTGFSTASRKGVEVNVAQTHAIDFDLRVGPIEETVNVLGGAPLVSTTSSSVGQVVDLNRVQSLPLNGRQFASLAATVPGVGVGFSVDVTKGVTLAPQVNGGAGRNVNFVVDGGDNNDDTVGGLLQQVPLEAIQEFNFQTQRFKAEHGRANGGVMNIVTKSGTNLFSGSLFEFFRDRSMNAITETEKLGAPLGQDPAKGGYLRNQFGGSFGGPIIKDKAHFFLAVERLQEEKTQPMGAAVLAMYPTFTGGFPVETRGTNVTGKVTLSLNSEQYLSLRYGRDVNKFPVGAAATARPDNWADAANVFDSATLNHNWVLGGSRLNELIVSFTSFRNDITARASAPDLTIANGTQVTLLFPNGATAGTNTGAPQATEQHKYQFRDDFSWHVTGWGGLGHDFKTGGVFIYEPRLYAVNSAAPGVIVNTMLNNDPAGPVRQVTVNNATDINGNVIPGGISAVNLKNKQYGFYFQDDWRVNDRLTLNLGVRYDLVTGLDIDQSRNPNFVKVQQAAQAGAFDGKIESLTGFGLSPEADKNNIQPRLGAVWDVRGNGKDILRGGWGIYTDFGYTNSNVLTAALDSSGSYFGTTFAAQRNAGLLNTDGSNYQVGQPTSGLSAVSNPNLVTPGPALLGSWADPRLQQPYQIQTNIGWSHELTSNTSVSVDYINSLGRDLNYRPRLNQDMDPTAVTARRISTVLTSAGLTALSPNTSSNRPSLSVGESRYDALIVGVRRRLSRGVDFSGSYTLSNGRSNIGNASDELNTANIQDPTNPFNSPAQMGPNALTDARHRISASAVFQLPRGIQVAPFFIYRSALPVVLIDGRDLNADGDVFDIPARAFEVDHVETGVDDTGKEFAKTLFEDVGVCQTVNCGRGSAQWQVNLRVSKTFRLMARMNIEAMVEVYNLFNALNPATTNRQVNSAAGVPIATFLQPTSFSGDNGRPEQRLGQVGFRVTF
ncbi:MAG: TonB-dependent receptor [Vicinamibacterales bacterium]